MTPLDASARLTQLAGQLRALAQNPPRGTSPKKLRGQRRAAQAKSRPARRNVDYQTKIIEDVTRRLR